MKTKILTGLFLLNAFGIVGNGSADDATDIHTLERQIMQLRERQASIIAVLENLSKVDWIYRAENDMEPAALPGDAGRKTGRNKRR